MRSSAPAPRVVILADSPARRGELRARAAGPGVEVVGETDSVQAAVRHPVADVIVVGGSARLEELVRIIDEGADLAVVGVIDGSAQAHVGEMAHVRGWALVTDAAPPLMIHAAIVAAHAGLAASPATEPLRAEADLLPPLDDDVRDEPLTGREQDVLELLATGLSNRRIAERLAISEHTVKFHVAAIYGKLGVSSRAAAVNRAIRRGVLKI